LQVLKERDHLGDISAEGRIILTIDFKEIGYEDVNWTELS
jgi:hypothetical protein